MEDVWHDRLMTLHAILAAAVCRQHGEVCDRCCLAVGRYMFALKSDVMTITGATEEEVLDWATVAGVTVDVPAAVLQ